MNWLTEIERRVPRYNTNELVDHWSLIFQAHQSSCTLTPSGYAWTYLGRKYTRTYTSKLNLKIYSAYRISPEATFKTLHFTHLFYLHWFVFVKTYLRLRCLIVTLNNYSKIRNDVSLNNFSNVFFFSLKGRFSSYDRDDWSYMTVWRHLSLLVTAAAVLTFNQRHVTHTWASSINFNSLLVTDVLLLCLRRTDWQAGYNVPLDTL